MAVTLENSVFVLVDVQDKLAQVMHERGALFRNLGILVQGIRALEMPILWVEQIPGKMGDTIPELRHLLGGLAPIPKQSFSAWGEGAFAAALRESGRNQVLLAGIEAHVCVYQTAGDLVENGYRVDVVSDAVSSRTARNRAIGLQKAQSAGAGLTSVETCLFELMRTSTHPAFRTILGLVK
jgi:nicotinamidase-related amidase